jgi:hypothetical protein
MSSRSPSTFALRARVHTNLRPGLPTVARGVGKRERRLVPEGRLELPTPRL